MKHRGAFGIVGILYRPLPVTLFLTANGLYAQGYRQRLLGS